MVRNWSKAVLYAVLVTLSVNSAEAQVSNITSSLDGLASTVLGAITSASSVASSASSVASSASSVGDSSLASSASSVASSASSVASSASSVISSVVSQTSLIPSSTSSISSVSSSISSTSSTSSSLLSSSSSSSTSSSTITTSSAPSTSSSSLLSTDPSSSASSSAQKSSTYTYSSVSSSVSFTPTVYSTANVVITTQADGQTAQSTSYAVVQTSVPATTVFSTMIVTSTSSPTGSLGLQADASSGGSSSLSTGAKAGIGAGVAVAVIIAAILGALWAMRRRRRQNAIADSDRYTPSLGPEMAYGSTMGGSAYGAGMVKAHSNYTESEMRNSHSPRMSEANPLDRYATPYASVRASLPPNSRTSDVSSMSGSEPAAYRPGPGMPAVTEHHNHYPIHEVPEQGYLQPGFAEAGNPFHKSGDVTPSLYSNEEPADEQPPIPQRQTSNPIPRQTSPTALELSGDEAHRNQLTKHMDRGNVAQNF